MNERTSLRTLSVKAGLVVAAVAAIVGLGAAPAAAETWYFYLDRDFRGGLVAVGYNHSCGWTNMSSSAWDKTSSWEYEGHQYSETRATNYSGGTNGTHDALWAMQGGAFSPYFAENYYVGNAYNDKADRTFRVC